MIKNIQKTVKVGGQDIKVDFEYNNYQQIEANEANMYYKGVYDFVINGKVYKVIRTFQNSIIKPAVVNFYYNGVKFPDNHKKVIEYIINSRNHAQ